MTKPAGVPTALFVTGAARWLGVRIEEQAEQPRVLLLSVPYALKAGDAATIGGLPPSAFVLAAPGTAPADSAPTTASAAEPSAPPPAGTVTGSGTIDFIPLWTSSSNIGNSVLFQSGTGSTAKIGINTSTPGATLDLKGSANLEGLLTLPATGTATASAGRTSQGQNFVASSYNSGTAAAVNQTFQWRAEPLGNDTATPSGTLSLLFGSGTASPAETGLRLGNTGLFTFAKGQTFPGTGTITGVTTASGSGLSGGGTQGTLNLGLKTCSANQVLQYVGGVWTCSNAGTGTVTSVASGTGLTGGPITGSGTLSLAANACAAGSALSALPFTCAPFATLGTNTFTGNQAVTGNITATGSVGVGTTAPGAELDIFSSTAGNHAPIARFGSLGLNDSNSILTYNGTGNTEVFQSGFPGGFVPGSQAGDGGLRVNPGKNIFFGDSGLARLELASNGDVGVGTTAPANQMDVHAQSYVNAINAVGFNVPSGSGLNGGGAVVAQGGTDDPAGQLSWWPRGICRWWGGY